MTARRREEVFRAVIEEDGLRQALLDNYFYRQGLAGRPSDRGSAARLAGLGLVTGKGAGFHLTAEGASLAYNLMELENQVHRGTVLPALEKLGIGPGAAVLDAGCGGGQTLLAAWRFRPGRLCGIDRDDFGIDFARFLFRRSRVPPEAYLFRSGRVEESGFEPGEFRHVICRGVLHKTRVAVSCRVFNSLLEAGGNLYLLVPGAAYYFYRRDLVRRNPAWLLFFAFVFLNGLVFASTGRQLTIGAGRKKCSELFFTAASLRRTLRRAGLKPVPGSGRAMGRAPFLFEMYAERR